MRASAAGLGMCRKNLVKKASVTLLVAAVIASFTFIFSGSASAAWEWSTLGTYSPGSTVWALTYDGTNLHAGCGNGTVYQNDLSGAAWTQTGSNSPGSGIYAIIYDGTNLYAGCLDGTVYQNDLSGGAWTQTGSDAPGSEVDALISDGTKLYAGCSNGYVFENALSGGAWTQIGSPSGSDSDVMSLAYDGTNLYAGCFNGTVYQNDLSGGGWIQTGSNPPPGFTIYALAYDGTNLYAGCGDGTVYQNALGGGAWTQTGSNVLGSCVFSLTYAGSTLYAGCNNGIVYENGLAGGAWVQAGSDPPPSSAVYALANDGSNLYAGCNSGIVFRKDLLGDAWTQAGSDTPGLLVSEFVYDGSYLYAACGNGAVYQNDLSGGAWQQTGSDTTGSVIWALAYDGSKLYAGCSDGAVYQNDLSAGDPWVQTGSEPPGSIVTSLLYDGTRLYAGCSNGVVYQNDLSGSDPWVQTGSDPPGSTVKALAYDGTNLYAGYDTGADGAVYANDLSGGAWQQTGSALTGSRVCSLAYDGSNLYAGCMDGTVHQNALAGGAWESTGSNPPGTVVYDLECIGSDLYAGCFDGTVRFIRTAFTVNAEVRGGGGTVSPATQDVPCRHDATIDINPGAGYHTSSVTDNGNPVTPTPAGGYTVNDVTRNHDVVVRFETNSPTVTSITPSSATNDATFNIDNLKGTNFREGAAVQLIGPTGSGESGGGTINAANVEVVSSTKITCRFDLAGAEPGSYGVRVTNEDGKSGEKQSAFSVNSSSSTWYLAEGSTAWGYDCYIAIENPNDQDLTADITYMTTEGEVDGGTVPLPAQSQTTVNPAQTLGEEDFSTLVECNQGEAIAVDRTMGWPAQGSGAGIAGDKHCSIGVTAPGTTWYLPEGSSAWGFECWHLVQNPNETEAHITLTYMVEGESPIAVSKTVPANARATYNMADEIGQKDASLRVESDLPVIPERAMYKNNRQEGHDSIGTTRPAINYYLAEGTTAWGFTTYVLVQNPQDTQTSVDVTYMTTEGAVAHPEGTIVMPANSRKTIRVNDFLPDCDFSTRVTGSQAIIAERAMYWGEGTEQGEACHDSIGMPSPHSAFYLPDGQAGSDVETWTLIQNPNDTDVMVEISYLPNGGGTPVLKEEVIPASSRKTFNLAEHSGLSGGSSVQVVCGLGRKVMVERAMYWYSRGAGTDTIGGYLD